MTSANTPVSIGIFVICLTTSAGQWKSRTRLWILICHLSKVLVPSPQGDLRTTKRNTLVGIRTGPDTLRFFSCAFFLSAEHTFSNASTLRDVKVIRIR